MSRVRSLRFFVALSLTSVVVAGCTAPIASSEAVSGGAQAVDGEAAPAPGPASSAMFLGIGYPPSALANDDTHVYWSELGSVFRAPKARPHAERLFGEGTSAATAIVVDGRYLYANDRMRGSLRAWSKSTGTLETLLPEGSDVSSLAQDSANLYAGTWRRDGGVVVISKTTHQIVGTLRRGKPVSKLALWGSTLFTAELDEEGRGTVQIVRSSTSGGEARVVGQGGSPPHELVADGDDAYWIDARGLMSTRGEAPIHAGPSGGFLSSGLSVIDGDAYVTEIAEAGASDGKVVRVPVAGGPPVVVAILSADAPAGAYRGYGTLQTFDRESFYVTTYWTNQLGTRRGDAIVKLRFPAKAL